MDVSSQGRGRGLKINGASRRPLSRNKHWVAGQDAGGHGSDGEKWERGGGHGHQRGRGGRGRGSRHTSPHLSVPTLPTQYATLYDPTSGTDDDGNYEMDEAEEDESEVDEQEPETPEERERFYQELVKAREVERSKAIAEGNMDDPTKPKRLEEAITIVGTCMDMCPRFERYRRERENNLDKWEVIPGTKRVDHKRAVKIYERAAGDKTIPSDLRPPKVLKRTLDYLFHDLSQRGGFSQTYGFIRDRSRAVRSDFTMQHETGALAIECHDRCARFHILALHLERENPAFSVAMEEQQLMNTLQSLKEFYEDQRGTYAAPTELEMRVYHRLIHIRDQRERHENIPEEITSHPVFQLTTKFRLHVQAKSAPITKSSRLVVDAESMEIFGQLAAVLREQNNMVMIYLVACILERLFGKETIEDIEAIRGDLTIPDIIDGISKPIEPTSAATNVTASYDQSTNGRTTTTEPIARSATMWLSDNFGPKPTASAFLSPSPVIGDSKPSFSGNAAATASQPARSAFANLTSTPNVFGAGTSVFGGSAFGTGAGSAFGSKTRSVFPSSIIQSLQPDRPAMQPQVSPPASSPFGQAITTQSPTPTKPAPSGVPPGSTSGSTNGALTNIPPSISPSATQTSHPVHLNPAANAFFPSSKPAPLISTPFPSSASDNPMLPAFTTPPPTMPPTSVRPEPRPLFANIQSQPVRQPVTQPTPTFFGFGIRPIPQPTRSDSSALFSNVQSTVTTPPSAGRLPHIKIPVQPETKSESPVPRIVERRQTLWEFPGASTTSPAVTDGVSFRQPPTPGGPASPREPPPLSKAQPMPLPPTPTARWFDPSSLPKPAESYSLSLRKQSLIGLPALQMPPSPTPADILSPLQLPSPGMARLPPSGPASPSPASRATQPVASTSRIMPESPIISVDGPTNGKGKSKEVAADHDLDDMALKFSQRSLVVRSSFSKWVQKTTDKAAWAEACRRSEAYSEQIRQERLFHSVGNGAPSKKLPPHRKRRMSAEPFIEPTPVKRSRRRASSQYKPPLTDEELVQRLKENQEEHNRRWAQGSFLTTIRSRVQSLLPASDSCPQWRIWLSINTENDGTAIWLEHKFDVPSSGEWASENVFSIPIVPKSNILPSPGSPGAIVFERTPLEGIVDFIERKYRVLDDCARLRDIIQDLPSQSKLRFIPALIVISWLDTDEADSTPDFEDMTKELIDERMITGVHTLRIPSEAKDLDQKFEDLIASVQFDVEDRLLQTLQWEGLTNLFAEPFKLYASDWLDSCWAGDKFDWNCYRDVLRCMEQAQSVLAREILGVLGRSPDIHIEMPVDLEAPAHLGVGYATGAFLDAYVKLAISTAEQNLDEAVESSYTVSRENVRNATKRLEKTLESLSTHLRRQAATAAMSTPPKRRLPDEDGVSPSSASKRLRSSVSMSEEGFEETGTNGIGVSPPPSAMSSTTGVTESAPKPLVTAAMLRALARDILRSK